MTPCEICHLDPLECLCHEELRSPSQNKELYGLLTKLGYDQEVKEALVAGHSHGRVGKSSLMTRKECDSLIRWLREQAQGDHSANKMRRKIFSLAHELGWEHKDGSVDRDHLNSWILKYGYLHKDLSRYTQKELPRLLTQLENILLKQYDKREKGKH